MHEHESDPVIEDVATTPAPPAPGKSGNGAPDAIAADVVELVFKGRRRAYYANPREIPLREGDYVIVQAERGEDLGRVHHTAEWVRRPELYGSLRHVLRPARPEDQETLERNRGKEERAFQICKDRVVQRDIEMKVVDCEYQLDGNRITFYFTAEKRVDFRDLVKDLAAAFRTRIELRQIGVRDEAGRIGGVGTCGRELCCSTWLRQFEPITLKMAKDQGLSPSPSKISGACGRLKCCLRYELDFYKDVAREFPKVGSKLTLMDGEWEVGRVDIFRREIHLVTDDGKESMIALAAIPVGTKIIGPSRDRRKGCDKEGCASRGAKPGDGESGPGDHGGARGGDRRPQRPGGDRRGRPGGDRQGGGDRGRGGDRPPRGESPEGRG
ncbi:MAG TPA: regulatory iron-sulfur-containing complex subunit RicT [Candidatus Eisenbacteria bacterium]|nr:regulatory iron-sulfur-containing complex subunit RicT [Candidatus Eisenbacteria bacterium]